MGEIGAGEKRFGSIAVTRGYITESQLLEAMKVQVQSEIQGSGHRLIGSVLSDLGYMNADQIMDVLKSMGGREERKPEAPEEDGAVLKRQLDSMQERRFGILSVKRGFVTPDQLVDALAIQLKEDLTGQPHRLIGTILYDLGFMTVTQIQAGLKELDRPFSEDEW